MSKRTAVHFGQLPSQYDTFESKRTAVQSEHLPAQSDTLKSKGLWYTLRGEGERCIKSGRGFPRTVRRGDGEGEAHLARLEGLDGQHAGPGLAGASQIHHPIRALPNLAHHIVEALQVAGYRLCQGRRCWCRLLPRFPSLVTAGLPGLVPAGLQGLVTAGLQRLVTPGLQRIVAAGLQRLVTAGGEGCHRSRLLQHFQRHPMAFPTQFGTSLETKRALLN
jgi:hypothetical protein